MALQTEIFSPQQFRQNEEKKAALIKLIRSGEGFLMAGAGLSKIQGYPLWKPFIQTLESKITDETFNKRNKEIDEPDIVYSTRLVSSLGEIFYDIINDTFGANLGFHACHVSLINLPFRGILTTNYDRILERAIRNKFPSADGIEVTLDGSLSRREIYKFLRSINENEEVIPKVVHIHGECRNANSIIFSGAQYEEKYGIQIDRTIVQATPGRIIDNKWTLHRKIIWALMATRRIVYVGFSMTDEYFQLMHQIVSDDVHFYDTDTHFLISRISKKDNLDEILKRSKWLKDTMGIETVFFEDDDDYKGLENFIFNLENDILKVTPPITSTEKPKMKEDDSITEKLFRVAQKLLQNDY